jgi:hypothetical protein
MCQPFRISKLTIRGGESTLLKESCPSDHPYVVGWDATHHEHITASVAPGTLTDNGFFLAISNKTAKPGTITVYLGCAMVKNPQKGNAMELESVGSPPTNTSAVSGQ